MLNTNDDGLLILPWSLNANDCAPTQQMLLETLFSQANGYIGSRGSYEEGLSGHIASGEGVYLNGVYQQEPIVYNESAYGYASHYERMIQVPNGKPLQLILDNTLLRASDEGAQGHRELDFKSGILNRTQHWHLHSGKRLTVNSRRFVSMATPNVMVIEYQCVAENFSGQLHLRSLLDAAYETTGTVNADDPRIGKGSIADSLHLLECVQQPGYNAFVHRIKGTDFVVASLTMDILPKEAKPFKIENHAGQVLQQDYQLYVQENQPITVYKWIGYDHSRQQRGLLSNLKARVESVCNRGFEQELYHHKKTFDAFWMNSDVEIEGDAPLQQGIRFNLLHVFQSTGRSPAANIAAKGLTGIGYDGHYFWDTEIYVIPFLCLTQPELARNLIAFRIHTLPQARERARQMAHPRGALYPWRTIGGQECSTYYPAGTAQYHINAAIAYALKVYIRATSDEAILWEGGAEMLVETARIWFDIGHFNARREGTFCINTVTGPDEYTACVNNNFYTNAMAQMHFEFAVEIMEHLQSISPQAFAQLSSSLQLSNDEIQQWQRAAKQMFLPYDETLGIYAQDDGFLDKPVWDFANTPDEHYPLLLHYHPLVIYRHQVLKQADVVLAMYLLDQRFDVTQKKRNLDYYEPLTTHDSTLSSCIHCIEYAEVGNYSKAMQFFNDTVRMDLDNHHKNSQYGVHIACMAGSWSGIVHGFGGVRLRSDGVHCRPYLPEQWNSYRFRFSYHHCRVQVTVSTQGVCYQLMEGESLTLHHGEHRFVLNLEQEERFIEWNATEPKRQGIEEVL